MNPPDAAPTPAPIHDILPPVDYFPYPLWMVAIAVLAAVALIGGLVWLFFLRKRVTKPLSAKAVAIGRLEKLRAEVDGADAYRFSIEVSEVVRGFLEESEGLRATRQTTREFLDSLRRRTSFPAALTDKLAGFLDQADLIKFARVSAGPAESRQLLDAAESLVHARASEPPPEVVK